MPHIAVVAVEVLSLFIDALVHDEWTYVRYTMVTRLFFHHSCPLTSSLWLMLNFLDSLRYSQVYNPYNNVPIGCFACCMTYNTQSVKTYTEHARYNSTYEFWYIVRSCASRLFYCYASSSSSHFWNCGFGSSWYIYCASVGCRSLSSSFVRPLDACMDLLKIQRHWPD